MSGIVEAILLQAAKAGGAEVAKLLIGLVERAVESAHPDIKLDAKTAIKHGGEILRDYFHSDAEWKPVDLPPAAQRMASWSEPEPKS